MAFTLRLPNITAGTPEGQMDQMQGYLYQMTEELEFALNALESGNVAGYGGAYVPQSKGGTGSADQSEKVAATFAEIKSLIIKSADIVEAYYEQMNEKFSGAYLAQSDFGVYAEKTQQDITKNSQGVTQAFENTQAVVVQLSETNKALEDNYQSTNNAIGGLNRDLSGFAADLTATRGLVDSMSTDIVSVNRKADGTSADLKDLANSLKIMTSQLEGVSAVVQEVKAVIKTGMLYDNGVPVYGLEIGQQVTWNGTEVFRKFCRLISDRLSFYDAGDNEVAYLSDNKMHVTEIDADTIQAGRLTTTRLQLGDYLLTVGADGHLTLN